MSMRLSDLVGAEVVEQGGKRIGHVFDIRVRRRAGSATDSASQQWRIVGLVLGRRGLWERLGLARPLHNTVVMKRDLLAWDQVDSVNDGRVVARAGATLE